MTEILTKQQIFDTASAHLIQQGVRSKKYIDGLEACLYRGVNGVKCAVGALISDETYHAAMEGYSATGLFDDNNEFKHIMKANGLIAEHRDLLRDLQRVHDLAQPEDWPKNLKVVADKHYLIDNRVVS